MVRHLALVLIFLLKAPNGYSFGNRQLQKFSKCYRQFTESALDTTHPLYLDVKGGVKTAADACYELLSMANLSTTSGILENNSELAKKILGTFNKFHYTWFSNRVPKEKEQGLMMSKDVVDFNMPGYYITRTLFRPDLDFDSIVKSNSALRAIRESNYVISDRVNYYKTLNNNNFQAVLLRFGQNKTEYISAAQLDGYRTERGRIIGFEDETRQLAIPRISGGNFDSFAHHGAGLLGSTPFIYMNTGLRSRNANGGINTARTFSVAVLKDLLCRELPVIWYQDAVPKLQASSSLAYRTSHSCNQCHVTMDPLAYVVRNKHFFAVGNAQDPLDAPLASVQVRVTDQSSDSGDIVDEPDPVFFRRAPTGKLYIRSLANDNYPYINGITMNGIPGLGNQLAQTFDLYLCAASRYFEFLTGYSMDFYAHDTSNPSSDRPAYNSDQMELLNYLRARASELQNHMDLQLMIKEMVNSPYY